MKWFMAFALSALLFQQSALAARYDMMTTAKKAFAQ
jgi:hypothetical protein